MKQYELADKAGVSTTTISAITRDDWDRISRDVMLAVCEALDCQPGDLFVRELEGDLSAYTGNVAGADVQPSAVKRGYKGE